LLVSAPVIYRHASSRRQNIAILSIYPAKIKIARLYPLARRDLAMPALRGSCQH
jgi:hypothetical protein